ncbi:MAG: hypothetical protein DRI99_05200 [Candidatus Aminicenantes bacterium]|nr:MAG: hypothetical protein DRI99_05200 [Candidatus Aminicenantes bacterium]
MRKETLFLITYALLMMITVPSLAALNENRLDVYISLFILEYFVANSIFRPRYRTKHDFLALILFTIFLYIVANRILEILLG